jgi:hypothetical protein
VKESDCGERRAKTQALDSWLSALRSPYSGIDSLTASQPEAEEMVMQVARRGARRTRPATAMSGIIKAPLASGQPLNRADRRGQELIQR